MSYNNDGRLKGDLKIPLELDVDFSLFDFL